MAAEEGRSDLWKNRELLIRLFDTAYRGSATALFQIAPLLKGFEPLASCRDGRGWTTVHFASAGNNLKVVEALLERVGSSCLSLKTDDGETPLLLAAKAGHTELCQRLLEKDNSVVNSITSSDGRSALHFAAQDGNYDLCKIILEHGGDPNICSESFGTPVFFTIPQKDSTRLVELFLSYKADPNKTADELPTPLIMACGLGKKALVDMLLAGGADPNIKDGNWSPLHSACQKGSLPIVESLFKNGAVVSDINGLLEIAKGNAELCSLLNEKR